MTEHELRSMAMSLLPNREFVNMCRDMSCYWPVIFFMRYLEDGKVRMLEQGGSMCRIG